jgi:F0F1-type ATP synthase membrane subunit b/b'
MWWIFPLMCFAFMIIMFFVMTRLCGRLAGFCGNERKDDIEAARREIQALKEEISNLRKRQ